MRVKILGKVWDLRFVNRLKPSTVGGDCDSPDTPNKAIRIVRGLHPKEEGRIITHEILHCGEWNFDESWVDDFSRDLNEIQWRLGYRRLHGKELKDFDKKYNL